MKAQRIALVITTCLLAACGSKGKAISETVVLVDRAAADATTCALVLEKSATNVVPDAKPAIAALSNWQAGYARLRDAFADLEARRGAAKTINEKEKPLADAFTRLRAAIDRLSRAAEAAGKKFDKDPDYRAAAERLRAAPLD